MPNNAGMNADQPQAGQAKMRPRARLISLLGDELISDEPVAVVELVKNAYDADATTVQVRFEGEDPIHPDSLVIVDDGCGMSLATVLTAWFEPGTVQKKTCDRSPGGRLFQGAKGVGRFAAARLAESLYMETRATGQQNGVTVLLNWGRFDDTSYLDEVEIQYEVRPIPQIDHGTKLSLMGLRKKKKWDDADFKALHDRLSRLISPFGEVEDFRIELAIPSHPELTGTVESHALTQQPKYRMEGTLSPDGSFTGHIQADGKQVKRFEGYQLGKKDEVVACGGFDVEMRAWDRDRVGLTPYMQQFNLGLREVRNVLDTYSGVSIYRDGFRVHPYGEAGNDWLQLDNRSRQSPTARLANNQLIAAIRTSRSSNPGLVDRTTREGLVHNSAYVSLTDWVVRILALLEAERYRLRPREDTQVDEVKTLFEVFDLSPVVQEADRQLGTQHPISQLVRKSELEIREGVQKLQEHYSRLLLTAGVGQIVDLVIHEMGAPIGRVNRELAHLQKRLGHWLEAEALEEAKGAITAIKGWLEQLVAFRNRLDPKAAGKRGRSTTFNVEEEIEGNLLLFENLLGKQNIKVEVAAPKKDPVIVHMTRAALGQILANLFDNSIYWLTRHHGDGKGGRISIVVTRRDHGFRVRFCDDGPGVEESDRERIFDPYYSTKANGMGLGLYIARQVIERYGKLTYSDECRLTGACFDAVFERNVGLS
jgi:signal transduction histidine kinase